MTSHPEKRSPLPRRAVLGTAIGGAAAVTLPGTAHAVSTEPAVATAPGGRRRPPQAPDAPGNSATP